MSDRPEGFADDPAGPADAGMDTLTAAAGVAPVEVLRQAVAAAVERAVAPIEATRAADTARLIERLEAIEARSAAATQRSEEQALALLAAMNRQIEPLVARLTEAVDTVVHAEGRVGALARGSAGESRAVEERVAVVLAAITDDAARTGTAVEESRVRLLEGQVALAARVDEVANSLLAAVERAIGGFEGRVGESLDQVAAAGASGQAAILGGLDRARQQLDEGLVAVRSALVAVSADQAAGRTQAERLAAAVAGQVEEVHAAVRTLAGDPRHDAVVLELAAGHQAQLAALDGLAGRISDVGPLVARALLSEVERAARAASAAEDAVLALDPEALRAALVDAGQAAIRDLVDRVAEAAEAHGAALHDLRAVQAALRQAVEDGGRQAAVAAGDVRGLRERLAPHLAALAEATTRRSAADQAGFDAVLARIDQLLARQGTDGPSSP
ncbi:MAG: hypothetical protein ABIS47_12490 [Acidimicrobiales bacterium]